MLSIIEADIKELKNSTIRFYPNPVNQELNFEHSDYCVIKVFNSIGQEIILPQFSLPTKTRIHFNTCSVGMYWIQVKNRSETIYFRIVKE